MSSKFRQLDRQTSYLLPPSLQDWLPEDHLARFVVELIDQLDLSSLETAYKGGGKAAYHPAMLLGILFYGYATGVFSSRQLEKATYDSVAFRFIAANSHPDHDTISSFRQRFLKELKDLFFQILELSQQMGLLKLGKVSLDGTKIKANASKRKALSWKRANELERGIKQEVEELLRRAEEVDKDEEVELDIPAELSRRESRLKVIKEAKEEIQRRSKVRYDQQCKEYEEKLRAREEKEKASGKKLGGKLPKAPTEGPRDKDQVNLTDAESRIMPSSEGFIQGFNAQSGVDVESHLVVSNHVSQNPNDQKEVTPTLDALKALEPMGKVSGLLADAGYHSESNVKACEQAGVVPYIAGSRERHNQWLKQTLEPVSQCADDEAPVTRMAHRLKTPEGKEIYARRKSTVETVFGVIKEVMGFRRFHLRGLDSVDGEWNLVCLAWNLKRMHSLSSAM